MSTPEPKYTSLADLGWATIQRNEATGEVFCFVPKGLHMPLGYAEQIATRLRMHATIPEGTAALQKFLAAELATLSVKLWQSTPLDKGQGHAGTPGPSGDGTDHFGLPWDMTRALIEEATGNLLQVFAELQRQAGQPVPERMFLPRADFAEVLQSLIDSQAMLDGFYGPEHVEPDPGFATRNELIARLRKSYFPDKGNGPVSNPA